MRRLLWTDGLAGATAGVVLLALAGPLAGPFGLPPAAVRGLGAVNLAYAALALSLAARLPRSAPHVRYLAAANLMWTVACLGLVLALRDTASWLGLAYVGAEGAVCAALGVLEARAVLRWGADQGAHAPPADGSLVPGAGS